MADPDQRTGSRNIRGGVFFKVRSTQDSFGAKWHTITKAEVDPIIK
jgi:hypothetical protein